MTPDIKAKRDFSDLRRRAEEGVAEVIMSGNSRDSRDVDRLIHELEVHRIELELQNEELRDAKAELDANYQELYDCAPVGYFTLGRYGDIEKTNLTGANLLGQPRAELLGRRIADFVEAGSLPTFNEFLRRVMRGSRKENCVVTLMTGGDSPVAAYIEATCAGPGASCRALVVDVTSVEHAGLAVRARGIAQERDMAEWVKADDASRTMQIELRRLAAKQLEAQESERRRIAADLHDGLGQSLSLLKLWIQEALRQMDAGVPPKTVESVKRLLPKVAGALDELRRAATELRPSILDDLGILATLSWFFREFESANLKTRIEKDIRAGEEDVPQPLKIVIFRILQEAVNNAVKHADADRMRISLHKNCDALVFTVEDDGKGFDPVALASRGDEHRGIGMQSMKERAELSDGTYALTSAVGKGTKVCVSWPAVKAADAQ